MRYGPNQTANKETCAFVFPSSSPVRSSVSQGFSCPQMIIKECAAKIQNETQMKYGWKCRLGGGDEGRMDIEEGNGGEVVLVVLQILPSWVVRVQQLV